MHMEKENFENVINQVHERNRQKGLKLRRRFECRNGCGYWSNRNYNLSRHEKQCVPK